MKVEINGDYRGHQTLTNQVKITDIMLEVIEEEIMRSPDTISWN